MVPERTAARPCRPGRRCGRARYFGLLPAFTGRGLGGHVLADVLGRAWSLPARWPELPPAARVWLHTCSLDSPRALSNYRARGLEVYRTEQVEQGGAALPTG
ncbi:hypothetical protein [Georgenia sp. SUBG003]|uniref:hypothetical protein n=1 Tax=Georgenia sp. SUBG003 TaxID=1497974 RepID=UPI003AB6A135